MKKIYFLFAFSLVAFCSFGQIKIYPKVGAIISNEDLDFGQAERENYQVMDKIGLTVGFGVERKLSPKTALTGDLQFAQLGYIERYKTQGQDWKEVYNTNYIIFPLSVKYIVRAGASSNLSIAAGPYGGVFLSGKHSSTHDDKYLGHVSKSENRFYVNDRYKYDRFDWGFQFGGAYSFLLGQNEFILETKYSIGVSKVHEISHHYWSRGSYTRGADGKNRFLSFSLAYVLPTGDQK